MSDYTATFVIKDIGTYNASDGWELTIADEEGLLWGVAMSVGRHLRRG